MRIFQVEGAPFFTFHHVNSYEAGPGGRYVVLDTCAADRVDFSLTTDNPVGAAYYQDPANCDRLTRVVLDTGSGKVRPRRGSGSGHSNLHAVVMDAMGWCQCWWPAATKRPTCHLVLVRCSVLGCLLACSCCTLQHCMSYVQWTARTHATTAHTTTPFLHTGSAPCAGRAQL
jgi:hypothetical protein